MIYSSVISDIYTQEITQSYRHLYCFRVKVAIYTQQKLLFSHIDTQDRTKRILIIYTQQKLLSHIDDLTAAPEYDIYTQQKLLSHIDSLSIEERICESTHSRNYLVIQTPCRLRSVSVNLHIVEITQSYRLCVLAVRLVFIYTQQKLLSHIDFLNKYSLFLIYTQQKLLSHIDPGSIPGPVTNLHIVEITQSYRHQLDKALDIFIYTQQKLLSHIDLLILY